MIHRTVHGNSVIIKGRRCTMQIEEQSSGKIVLEIEGQDEGELGRIPFDELDARLSKASGAQLFVDTSRATGVSLAVVERWAKWFGAHKAQLEKVFILAPQRFFLVTARILKELSRTGDILQIYEDKEEFLSAMKGTKSSLRPSVHFYHTQPPEIPFSGNEIYRTASCTIHLIRLRPGVLYVKISGFDRGENVHEILGALTAELNAYPGPMQLFVNAAQVSGVAEHVSQSWTGWISLNGKRILDIFIHSQSQLTTLIVSAAAIFSRTGELIKVVSDQEAFLRFVEHAAPGSKALL